MLCGGGTTIAMIGIGEAPCLLQKRTSAKLMKRIFTKITAIKFLSMMAEKKDDVDILLYSEIFRNLGEFSKCKSLLAEMKDQEKYERYITSINAACDAEKMYTFQVQL